MSDLWGGWGLVSGSPPRHMLSSPQWNEEHLVFSQFFHRHAPLSAPLGVDHRSGPFFQPEDVFLLDAAVDRTPICAAVCRQPLAFVWRDLTNEERADTMAPSVFDVFTNEVME